jgi:hypothetical protein
VDQLGVFGPGGLAAASLGALDDSSALHDEFHSAKRAQVGFGVFVGVFQVPCAVHDSAQACVKDPQNIDQLALLLGSQHRE